MRYSIGDVVYLNWHLLKSKDARTLAGGFCPHRFIIYDCNTKTNLYSVICTTSNKDIDKDPNYEKCNFDWESATPNGVFTKETVAVLSSRGEISEDKIKNKIGSIAESDVKWINIRLKPSTKIYQKIENFHRPSNALKLRIREND